jgi:hypothetical protein
VTFASNTKQTSAEKSRGHEDDSATSASTSRFGAQDIALIDDNHDDESHLKYSDLLKSMFLFRFSIVFLQKN